VSVCHSPHNPTGKVFGLGEMESLARLVSSHPRALVISDEVYKYTIYNQTAGVGMLRIIPTGCPWAG
jgi:aspartate/methionine/tyrosine aminotransferase